MPVPRPALARMGPSSGCAGDRPGSADRITAATADTYGVAIDVPEGLRLDPATLLRHVYAEPGASGVSPGPQGGGPG